MKVTLRKERISEACNLSLHYEFDKGFSGVVTHHGFQLRGAKGGIVAPGTKNYKLAVQAIANYDLTDELILDSILDRANY